MNSVARPAPSAGMTAFVPTTPTWQPSMVSVILPVRDGAQVLAEQLEALSGQTYDGAWELIIADNGSNDETVAVIEDWRQRFPCCRVVDAADRPGAAHARNRGAAAAHGEVLVFCDADDVVDTDWLAAMTDALAEADVAAGRIDTGQLNDAISRRWRPFLAHESEPVSHGWMPYALTASAAFRATAFRALGGFREDYSVGEDVELCWRAQLHSMRFTFVADAVVHYRYRRGLWPLLRQYVAYGTIGPRLYRDFREAGMPASPARAAAGPWLRLLTRLPIDLFSRQARGDTLRRLAFRIGRIIGSLRTRVLYF